MPTMNIGQETPLVASLTSRRLMNQGSLMFVCGKTFSLLSFLLASTKWFTPQCVIRMEMVVTYLSNHPVPPDSAGLANNECV